MTWVKLDDNFPDHPKVVNLSDSAFRSYVEALCYSSRLLTGGFIPHRITHKRASKELTAAGLWVEVEGGFQIHDFHVYNPPSEEVKERRRQAAERTKRWRDGRRDASHNASGDA